MKKKIIYNFLLSTAVITILFIAYFSTIGIETDRFNKQITSQISGLNKNLEIDLKEIKLVLEPFNFKIKVKTLGPKLKVKGGIIEIESIKSQISLKSFFKDEFSLTSIDVSTKSVEIKKLTSLIREVYNKPKLIILENFIKKGYLIADISLEFDESGKIKNNYNIKGFIKDGKISLQEKHKFEKINLIFDISKKLTRFKEIQLSYNKLDFFLDHLDVTKKDKDLLFKGKLQNKNFKITNDNIIDVYDLNILGIKRINFNSTNLFSFKLKKNLKFDDLKFESEVKINELVLANKLKIDRFLPNIKNEILFLNHNLKINYNRSGYFIKGNGKIVLNNNKDKINYSINKKNKIINFNTLVEIEENPLDLDFLNFKKKKNISSLININGVRNIDSSILINNFSIKDKRNLIELKKILISNDSKIVKLQEGNFNYFDNNNSKNIFRIFKKKDNYVLNGSSLNAESFIEKIMNFDNESKFNLLKHKIQIDIDLNEVQLDNEFKIKNFKGNLSIKDNTITTAVLSGFFSNNKKLKFTVDSKKDQIITTFFSEYAEPFLKRYKFIKGFNDGILDYYSVKKNDKTISRLKIYDFRIKEAPVLTKILSLASLQGIADLVSGEGIRFNDFEMNFENEKRLIKINEIYALGPAISMMMDGYIEKKKLVSLRGTLVPATTLNKVIGSIPLLGDILVGSKIGEGVFGVSFKIKGPPKNLETTVNPIKTLTPRFITRTLEKIKKN